MKHSKNYCNKVVIYNGKLIESNSECIRFNNKVIPIIETNISNVMRKASIINLGKTKSMNTINFTKFINNDYYENINLINTFYELNYSDEYILQYIISNESQNAYLHSCISYTKDINNYYKNIELLQRIIKNGQLHLFQYNIPPRNKF